MFNGFIMKIRRFMTGRYGNDTLNTALLIFGCVVTFVLSILSHINGLWWIRIFSYIPFVLAVVRMLSRNIYARQKENEKFIKISTPWRAYAAKKAAHLQDREHRYFNCPVCKKTLRVPADRGKIEITCPHCGKKFKKRT